jgi:hypothetical protein
MHLLTKGARWGNTIARQGGGLLYLVAAIFGIGAISDAAASEMAQANCRLIQVGGVGSAVTNDDADANAVIYAHQLVEPLLGYWFRNESVRVNFIGRTRCSDSLSVSAERSNEWTAGEAYALSETFTIGWRFPVIHGMPRPGDMQNAGIGIPHQAVVPNL